MNALPGCEPQRRFEELVFRWLPLAGMLAASVAAFVFGPGWSARAAAVPWLISLVFVGLPHGAADLAIAQRLGSRTAAARMFIGYLAVMAAVFVGFAVFPVPLVLLFATLSIWHFGMSHADGQSPSIPAAFWPRLRAAVARGAGVLGVPLACWPAETSAVAARLLSVMGGNAAAGSFAPAGVRATGIALVAIALAAVSLEVFETRRVPGAARRSFATLVDLAVIGLLGITTDPLFSVGMYFLCWHAWRHLWLLSPLVARVQPADAPTLGRALLRLHVAALPLLIPTWTVLLAGWWWLSPDHSLRDLAILSLAVYLVVTPSHDLLIDLLRARTGPARETGDQAAADGPTSTVPPSCAARLASSSL